MKHLVVDGQCLQTDSLQRGIGRYSLALFRELTNREDLRVTLLLNEIALQTRDAYLLQEVRSWEHPRLTVSRFPTASARLVQFPRYRRSAEHSRVRAISTLKPDAVLVLSVMQRSREVILSAPPISDAFPTYAVLYDLIHMRYPNWYLSTPSQRREHARHIEILKAMTGLLSISEATARDWRWLIGDKPSVHIIGGGPAGQRERHVSVPVQRRSGVICLGAEGPHKNLEVLLDAFGRLPQGVQLRNPLTITGIRQGSYQDYLRRNFHGAQDALSMPGYVEEHRLQEGLASARVLAMPSLVEGFGLPVAEALVYGTPCVVSAETSMTEISRNSSLHFNAVDASHLQSLLLRLLGDDVFWMSSHALALEDAQRLSWSRVADRVVDQLSAHQQ